MRTATGFCAVPVLRSLRGGSRAGGDTGTGAIWRLADGAGMSRAKGRGRSAGLLWEYRQLVRGQCSCGQAMSAKRPRVGSMGDGGERGT